VPGLVLSSGPRRRARRPTRPGHRKVTPGRHRGPRHRSRRPRHRRGAEGRALARAGRTPRIEDRIAPRVGVRQKHQVTAQPGVPHEKTDGEALEGITSGDDRGEPTKAGPECDGVVHQGDRQLRNGEKQSKENRHSSLSPGRLRSKLKTRSGRFFHRRSVITVDDVEIFNAVQRTRPRWAAPLTPKARSAPAPGPRRAH
jgi:hypothetical protein